MNAAIGRALSDHVDAIASLTDVKRSEVRARARSQAAELAGQGRRPRSDAAYVSIAVEYLMALEDTRTQRSPAKAAAERLHLSTNTVKNLLSEAEHRGLIDGRHRGRAGLHITPKGIQALEQEVAQKHPPRVSRGKRKGSSLDRTSERE
jgi:DNA-binding transcriptional MocR family regulator